MSHGRILKAHPSALSQESAKHLTRRRARIITEGYHTPPAKIVCPACQRAGRLPRRPPRCLTAIGKGTTPMIRWQFPLALLLACNSAAPAADLSFDREIQPLLMRCVQCHGPGKARAGLRLDSRAAAIAVLESGKQAIVPGHPEQ